MQYVNDALIQAIIDNGEYRIRPDYSGRAMYGRCCLGITTDGQQSAGELMADLLCFAMDLSADDREDALEELCDMLRAMQADQMGLGMVFYFPGFTLSDEMKDLIRNS